MQTTLLLIGCLIEYCPFFVLRFPVGVLHAFALIKFLKILNNLGRRYGTHITAKTLF